ncbi:phospholipid/cholesterol/gamma-HCH transport system substrate-binding protein [Paenimyroides aquimaris]|uniref:Phospholipid/cholesterol/gamma-HCH transport system substrate-binding protein n=1 Tax=Paenimyroides marinum TaxID=1159016 RepID=A0A1H6JUP2_9FLAO|nr:MlaD family protein [Paenimyroides aquimaris]SEH66062.1 phospholipid/cholesterol/gamma-HCH transport system substrate-binding protein [Paenimyroides aquimaris]
MKIAISREVKTAVLVLLSIGMLIWGYTFLNGKNIFSSSRTFFVEYDNVEGLSTASSVTINGMVVGKVHHISLKDQGKLLVELMMTENVDVPKSSKAIIYSPGFIGGKQIALEINYKDPELAQSGDYLQAGSLTGLIDGLGEKVDPIAKKLDSVLYNVNILVQTINKTLDPAAQKNLQDALAQLNATMTNANAITGKFDRIVSSNETKINNIVSDFNTTSKNLSAFSNDLDKIQLQKLQDILNKFDSAASNLDNMMTDINSGKGNLGKLMKEEQLYQNLEDATKELNQLLEDVKLNPRRYINISVFGKKAAPYEEPVKP